MQRTREDMQRMMLELQKVFDGHIARLESSLQDGKRELSALGDAFMRSCTHERVCARLCASARVCARLESKKDPKTSPLEGRSLHTCSRKKPNLKTYVSMEREGRFT